MSSNTKIISASLSNGQRQLLLRHFSPTFASVFCMQVTWAYDVSGDFPYPHDLLDLTVFARHIGDDTECLLVRIGKADGFGADLIDQRPDGNPLHITLSTRPGIPPARAGDVDLDCVEQVDPVTLRIQFHHRKASRLVPTAREKMVA